MDRLVKVEIGVSRVKHRISGSGLDWTGVD